MQLPFGTDEFFNVFVRYNEAVEPVQVILIAWVSADSEA